MTQRIFDIDNPQDVQDLFNLVPEKVQKIEVRPNDTVAFLDKDDLVIELSRLFCIDWCCETKITRPVDEESWIGKIVYVWDNNPDDKKKAILLEYNPDYRCPFGVAGNYFKNAELCED